MELKDADNNDLSAVLKETCRIWSPGLSQRQYFDYLSAQISNPWARKSMRFLVLKEDPESPPLGALKYYHLSYRARGLREPVEVAGLGAIFTPPEKRGQGLGKTMVKLALARAEAEGMAAVMLYSDIGSDFYLQFGFSPLDSLRFESELIETGEPADKIEGYCVGSAIAADGERLRRYYQRWQSRQPLAISRSDSYWHFMIDRDAFIHRHNPTWAPLEAIMPTADSDSQGYALFRTGRQSLRVLEVCAGEESREEIWRALVAVAATRGRSRLEGWESALAGFYPDRDLPSEVRSMRINMRLKEKGMILVLRQAVANWRSIKPVPFMEFDHF
ncbi:MAG: GNAT family N-acetyltransferase [Cyanobacteria bacterium HKST-UBA02]|nr:GNAT family N-acetyltransferase [Cyanobacteria bacterium HKST-UBA02]